VKILILGLGNPILSDDGIGIKIAKELLSYVDPQKVEIKEASVGGMGLIDLIEGYKKVIIIDSIKTEKGKVGQVYNLNVDDLHTSRLSFPHNISFAAAIKLAKKIGLKMPDEIKIYAVEVEDNFTFSEKCSTKLKKAIPKIVKEILNDLL
jgi:hydrogenase maturation protease